MHQTKLPEINILLERNSNLIKMSYDDNKYLLTFFYLSMEFYPENRSIRKYSEFIIGKFHFFFCPPFSPLQKSPCQQISEFALSDVDDENRKRHLK